MYNKDVIRSVLSALAISNVTHFYTLRPKSLLW